MEDSERIEDIPDINASKPDFTTQDSTKVEFSKVADKNESQSKSIDVEDPKTAEQQNEPEIAGKCTSYIHCKYCLLKNIGFY